MTDNEFTLEEDERLIEEIARRPEIYDPNHAGYKQLTVKDQRWADIAKKLDKAVDHCKRRWKNLRDNYFKQLKSGPNKIRRRKNTLLQKLTFLDSIGPRKLVVEAPPLKRPRLRAPTDEGLSVDSSNQQETLMDTEEVFQPVIHQVQDFQQTEHQPMSETATTENDPLKDVDIVELLSGVLKRRDQENANLINHILSLQNQRKSEDELELFFKCILLTMRKLPPAVVSELKGKIFALVSEQEIKMLQPTARPDSSMSINSDVQH
ncbi:unnamed protein product [Bemisia tabaci]|uniref:Transcription factor Adf-1 n=1 Tax=Bemisia tabaci TaxID=7038 RepID=A0A9P0AB70_BEMTA|nr:unnamed protein product [Bemisia tabaci]